MEKKDPHTVPLEELGLSRKALLRLKRYNFLTVGQVLSKDKSELREVPNIGEKLSSEIYHKIQKWREKH